MNRTVRPPLPPESYVVRIYRRNATVPGRIAGTVEFVGSGSELSFRSLRELQRILIQAGAGSSRAQSQAA